MPARDSSLELRIEPFQRPCARDGRYSRALALGTKRSLDVTLAFVGLFMLAPLLLAVALAIRLDSRGPALFRQNRGGRGGRTFRIVKFRTMAVDENGAEIRQAARGDARVTRVGAFLRRTSIDELPQLFNVLKGEMSFVGPRPHAVAHDEHYAQRLAGYSGRLRVRPGITGWAQVTGARGETPELSDMRRRVELDLWYVEHWSLLLDAKILFRTVGAVIQPENVY
jgi:exopolysaccharide biosynthesis polyprenyl glycosylphosphotransferase